MIHLPDRNERTNHQYQRNKILYRNQALAKKLSTSTSHQLTLQDFNRFKLRKVKGGIASRQKCHEEHNPRNDCKHIRIEKRTDRKGFIRQLIEWLKKNNY